MASEVEKKSSSQVAIPESVSGFHGELTNIQRKLTKLGSGPKSDTLIENTHVTSRNKDIFHYHYQGPERDLVKLNAFERVVDCLSPGVALTALSALWFTSTPSSLLLTDEITFLAALVAMGSITIVLTTFFACFAGILGLIECDDFYLLSLKNRTINKKRYRRELQKFLAEEDKKRQLHEAALVKYHKKREKLKAALEPLSAQYADANPGRSLTVSKSNKIVEGVDVDLSTVDRIALNSLPGVSPN